MSITAVDTCHCDSGRPFADCCEPLLQHRARADSAEQLMRSRYSAFCLHAVEYLLDTLHPSQRQATSRQSLRHAVGQQRWVRLQVDTRRTRLGDDRAEVRFSAFCVPLAGTQAGQLCVLKERARFLRESGRWYYLEGDSEFSAAREAPFTRNEPCWCGSGRKFKRCHG